MMIPNKSIHTLWSLLLVAMVCSTCGPASVPRAVVSGEETAVAVEKPAAFAKSPGPVLSMRDRIEPVNQILKTRLETLLPRLMREVGIDMWVVINREYNEDPTFFSLVPEPVFAAGRTTILMFFDQGGDQGVERISVRRRDYGGLYQVGWKGGAPEAQWKRLAELIEERNPKQIGINVSRTWAFADGLSASLEDQLREALGESLSQRLTSAEKLVIRWLETRTGGELEIYPGIVSLARGVIAEAFSNRVITPGTTTTEDVVAHIAQRFADLNLQIWFHPTVAVQHPETECTADSPICMEHGVIRPGDLLHTDVGICYLRLCTDTQEMGYVLKPGETDVPEPLKAALALGNHWQDLLTGEFQTGRSGNAVLTSTLAAMKEAGITGAVYTHPLGAFGHGPGPVIGLWDRQETIPDRGDWPLHPDTVYAIEGNIKAEAPGWSDQLAQIKLEQDALFDGEQVHFLSGRQTEWHIVRP